MIEVKITQADRNSASLLEPNGRERDQILRGKRDRGNFVQTMARHRQQAEDAMRERCTLLEGLLVEAEGIINACVRGNGFRGARKRIAAATAIRAATLSKEGE